MSKQTRLAIFVTIFLWASAFVGIRAGLKDYSPEGLALLRFFVAALCMLPICFSLPKNALNIPVLDRFKLLALGVFAIGVYNVTLNYGELNISSGMSSFIISQSPLVTACIAIAFLGERLTLLRLSGFSLSFLGVSLIASGEIGSFSWDSSLTYILIATFIAGCYSILQKPFLKKYHPIAVTTYIIWGGLFFLLIYSHQLYTEILKASIEATAVAIYLGVFPAALGYLAWSYVLMAIPASRAVSFLYFMPFLALVLGWVYLHEFPPLISFIGALLAILGVWVVNFSYEYKKRKEMSYSNSIR